MQTKIITGECPECDNGETTYLHGVKPKMCKRHDNIRKQERKRRWAGIKKDGIKIDKESLQVNTDDAWYKYQWKTRRHFCEECGKFLGDKLSHMFVSHIISKGSHPALRTHVDNCNILCADHHQQYEFGDRKSMKVYEKNKPIIIKMLQSEIAKATCFKLDKPLTT